MRKKLSLAAALLPAPRLLFLDEPFEGIDAVASRQIKDLLQSFVARGGTIFLTSHILEIVERLSTHIGVIADGRLVAQGPIDELAGWRRRRQAWKSCSSAWSAATRASRWRSTGSDDAENPPRVRLDALARAGQLARADRRARHARALLARRSSSSGRSSRSSCSCRRSSALPALGGFAGYWLAARQASDDVRGVCASCCSPLAASPSSVRCCCRRWSRPTIVRLLLLPIPRQTLYLAQAAGAISEPWVIVALPVVAVDPGRTRWPAARGRRPPWRWWRGSSWSCASSACRRSRRLLLHLLVRDRRRGELVMLMFIVFVPVMAMLPGLLLGSNHGNRDGRHSRSAPLPAWVTDAGRTAVAVVPSELYARATREAARHESPLAVVPILILTASCATGPRHWFSDFRAAARVAIGGSRRRSAATGDSATLRLPMLSRGSAAVAQAHLRLATAHAARAIDSAVPVRRLHGVCRHR